MDRKKIERRAALAAVPLFALPLAGCGEKKFTSLGADGYAMATRYELVVSDDFGNAENVRKLETLCGEISSLLYDLEASLSVSVSDSSVARFNRAAAGERVEIDRTAYEVLSLAQEMYAFTEGYYNPAVYYSVDLYGFAARESGETAPYDERGEDGLPKAEYVEAFRSLAPYFGDVALEQSDGKYYATKPSEAVVEAEGVAYPLKIDLSGIGKGYAVDLVNAMVGEAGFDYGRFVFGSSSIAVKKSYSGENGLYSVSLTDPRGFGSYLSFSAKDVCVSSSGDYEKYYEWNGVRYCHIVDPFTGMPVQTGIMTATVAGGTAARGDALTTAIMAMGKEKAVSFINEKLSDLSVVFTLEENLAVVTNLKDGDYTLTNENYTVIGAADLNGKIAL